jgi:hypothetical protein
MASTISMTWMAECVAMKGPVGKFLENVRLAGTKLPNFRHLPNYRQMTQPFDYSVFDRSDPIVRERRSKRVEIKRG